MFCMSKYGHRATLCVALAIATVWNVPAAIAQPPNLGELKNQLKDYQQSGDYAREQAAVISQAQAYIDAHVGDAPKPAVILDIDETSLSNWDEIKADDFGYFVNGDCSALPNGPCGNLVWTKLARAAPIAPTVTLFNDAIARGIAVFFITGRHETDRCVTEQNLRQAGYANWTALIMEPDNLHPASAADFKAPERAKIEAQGYHIIADIGDQQSDLDGGHAGQPFRVPNPFYLIP
jgi:predicted secreted acid phosphatase